ncbi:uncharacterized protein LOC135464152 [Liolophura sinensis]|uniref:uncharacterized protein LOC135464152 n=1 Tax=Liolophura sinensis TaxID=3198878 RepID=UPI0031586CBC
MPHHHGGEEFALFIGGLRCDRKISFLKRKLIELFNMGLGISLVSSHVNIIAPPGKRFAFVYLVSAEEMDMALECLGSPENRAKLEFDFDEIQNQSHGLSVQIKLSRNEMLLSEATHPSVKLSQDIRDYKALRPLQLEPLKRPFGNHLANHSVEDSTETKENKDLGTQTSVVLSTHAVMEVDVDSSPHDQTGFRHANTSTTGLFRKQKAKRKIFGNAGTSTTGLIAPGSSNHSLPDKYLIMGQYLGNETRNVEFKRGGGQYMKKQLKDHVAKYVCCFLNAGEGGSLFIGVDDNGAVQGVECNFRQENDLRLLIDSIIKGMVPQVFPQQYTVSFVPVLELQQEHLTPIANVQVIEIHVEAVGKPDRLYETQRGEVYIRRDGSVQGPLRASDIQEWTRMVHRQEEKGRRGELHRLQEEIDSYRQREAELRDEQDRLLQQVQHLQNRRLHKSRACSIL